MATTAAQSGGEPKARQTRLNKTTDEPSFVAPGDGPHDTTDPSEQATSVPADKAAAAAAGFGVVNAVVPLPEHNVVAARPRGGAVSKGDQRTETYEVTGPDGKPVTVTHNIDTGETKRS